MLARLYAERGPMIETQSVFGADAELGPAEPSGAHLLNFRWLTALRWVAVVGQTLAIGFVHVWMEVPLPVVPLMTIVGSELVLNLLATRLGQRRDGMTEVELAAWVGFDLVAFTLLLYFSGGPSNPFSFFFIVHVAMAALTLRAAIAWALVALSVINFAGLFAWHVPVTAAAQSGDVYLYGVWVAYGLCASCVVYFMHTARGAIEEREKQLSEQRELRLQAERLSSLATLAAGAAHELANPLSTIAVVSKELEYELAKSALTSAMSDVALVRTQVERCRKILTRMAHTAGEAPGEAEIWLALDALVSLTVDELPEKGRLVLWSAEDLLGGQLRCRKEALAQALRVLLDNALDASEGEVKFRCFRAGAGLRIEVSDEGNGMDAAVLQHAFEPFFTTKPAGKGMGLGLYLARNVVTEMGGTLSLDSTPGYGTRAQVNLPITRFRSTPQK